MRLREGALLPRRQSALATGFDLHACLSDGVIEVGERPVLIPTGIALAAPPGTDVQIRPRSGLSARGVIATFGTIDADYRGELFVTMYALPAASPHLVRDGDRIAQLVVCRLPDVRWAELNELDATARGAAGHGSTDAR
ncbi:MAG: dUTP diphosphatase [Gemmatimonadaceae bacterium]|nr:dUTP diphosphatase [Gemmatimonadaceae bacterium]